MCTSNVYVDQSPSALNLTLIEGELDLIQFSCLAEMTYSAAGLDITATIIGASHVLSFYRDGTPVFHEVLACVQPVNDQVLRTWPINELPVGMEAVFDGISYSFTHTFMEWGPAAGECAYSHLVVARDENDEYQGVYFLFPRGDLEYTPITAIVIPNYDNDTEIDIHTVHSYPGQGLVKSTTIVNTKEV